MICLNEIEKKAYNFFKTNFKKLSFILTLDFLDLVGHHLVEDMVGSLERLLGDDTSLLQQVDLNVTTRQLAIRLEVDTDELTLKREKRK